MINQNCAARSKQLNCWVRGRIQKIQSNQKCIVFFIDFGMTEELRWDELAVLSDEFCKACDGVFKCSLLDIVSQSNNGYKWTEAAINDFRRYTSSNILTICIGSYDKGTYAVTLFYNQKDRDICVNAKLVEAKHCGSSGPESARLEFKNGFQYFLDDSDSDLDVAEEFETVDKHSNGVTILNIISPDKFYVSLSQHLPKLQELEHQIHLKMLQCQTIQTSCNWTINEPCFVLTNQNKRNIDKKWCRAYITDITDENIKVFLRDKGISIKVLKGKKILFVL